MNNTNLNDRPAEGPSDSHVNKKGAGMKQNKKHTAKPIEAIVHGIFLAAGLITVGCVLLITVYLIISGLPAIKEIGLIPFLFG